MILRFPSQHKGIVICLVYFHLPMHRSTHARTHAHVQNPWCPFIMCTYLQLLWAIFRLYLIIFYTFQTLRIDFIIKTLYCNSFFNWEKCKKNNKMFCFCFILGKKNQFIQKLTLKLIIDLFFKVCSWVWLWSSRSCSLLRSFNKTPSETYDDIFYRHIWQWLKLQGELGVRLHTKH